MRDDWIRIAQGQRRIKRIVARTGIAGGRLLDVASASGFFGVAARSVGFDVTCIEPDEKLARMGREAYGLLIIAATVEDCELEPAAYDIVTIWGADVHFLHPVHSIEKLVTALKPGGVLALTYQASDHWIRRIFPRMMTGWHMIYNHTDRSFEATLRRLGLELVSRELEWQTVTVDQSAASSGMAESRCCPCAGYFLPHCHREKILSRVENGSIANCGLTTKP